MSTPHINGNEEISISQLMLKENDRYSALVSWLVTENTFITVMELNGINQISSSSPHNPIPSSFPVSLFRTAC